MAKSLIANYYQKKFIDYVWLCGKAPVCARVRVDAFVRDIKHESPSTIRSEYRTVSSVESSIFERIKGGKYQINGLDLINTGLQGKMVEKDNASTEVTQAVSQDAIENILKELNTKNKSAGSSQRQPKQGRYDTRQGRGEALS